MHDLYLRLITNQYEAALCMLGAAIDHCPDTLWTQPVVDLTFDQAAFHTLFFTDLYLGDRIDEVRQQPFHTNHADYFRDYEELEDRRQRNRYDRSTTVAYLEHCREKAREVLGAETEQRLAARCQFPWLDMPRAEMHVYNIRHVHHHAAQLSLKLRKETGRGVPWIGSGWRRADAG